MLCNLSPCKVGGYFSHSANGDHKVLKSLSNLSSSKVSRWSCQKVCSHSALLLCWRDWLLTPQVFTKILHFLSLVRADPCTHKTRPSRGTEGTQSENSACPSSRIRTVSNPYPPPCASPGEERSIRKWKTQLGRGAQNISLCWTQRGPLTSLWTQSFGVNRRPNVCLSLLLLLPDAWATENIPVFSDDQHQSIDFGSGFGSLCCRTSLSLSAHQWFSASPWTSHSLFLLLWNFPSMLLWWTLLALKIQPNSEMQGLGI